MFKYIYININVSTYSDLWDILFALVRHGLFSVDADVFILFFSDVSGCAHWT